ncbi:23S rRNA (adenine(2030)-N(6))-methyltransferase RlmJ [Amorphus orientalis]|uniref:Ribosomal RNA large subunit methyltransferase J n=1 Tax=Amorphus orientalis TaxID=649198 RepID=A0AAE3VPX3_9HYPH|nr:23S rRNA (adenine(2030)-N(6))-methyltransferase RlmJ [Amorphus orientalis]MDQ0316674.1 23S rRNA (adenine2030-N6)-methyltransferase [Amorphus orientalis]
MNYRHAFHAGNFGDVLKHVVVARIVRYMQRKDGAIRVIDTHAGVGLYDLSSDEALRTGEAERGATRVLQGHTPPEIAELIGPWREAVAAENPDGGLLAYPGSPRLVRHLMRPQDRLTAVELHPADGDALRHLFTGDYQVRIVALDGWLALGAFVPPKERRGLVLVDPAFEVGGEAKRLGEGIAESWRKWPTGVYCGWYPIKAGTEGDVVENGLVDAGIAKRLRVELTVRAPAADGPMAGCGLAIVNPPYTLKEELDRLLPWLAETLAEAPGGGFRVTLAGS